MLLLLTWNNVIVTRLPGYPLTYVAFSVAAIAVLLAAARTAGLSWPELGLGRRQSPAGARWGMAGLALVAVGYAAALAAPGVRPLLADARVAGLGGGEVAYQVLVRIPLGTVLWEEVAFRGVLLAALARVLSLPWAVALSATVFGVWHIRPTLSALAANGLADGTLAVLAVLLACLGTAVAGALLAWLRLRTGSLLAPALLHLATNCLGAVAAAAAFRLS